MAMPSRPSSHPLAVATLIVTAGSLTSRPPRMTRTRPGRSVSQALPSLAKSIAQGATRSWATDCWLSCSGPGGLRVDGVGDRAGCMAGGDFDGRTPVPCCLAAVLHATSVTTASETARMRWSTGPKATTGCALKGLRQFPWDLGGPEGHFSPGCGVGPSCRLPDPSARVRSVGTYVRCLRALPGGPAGSKVEDRDPMAALGADNAPGVLKRSLEHGIVSDPS